MIECNSKAERQYHTLSQALNLTVVSEQYTLACMHAAAAGHVGHPQHTWAWQRMVTAQRHAMSTACLHLGVADKVTLYDRPSTLSQRSIADFHAGLKVVTAELAADSFVVCSRWNCCCVAGCTACVHG